MSGPPPVPAQGQKIPRFSLVVPIYNEEDNVAALLDEVHEVLTPHGPFEALLVDDGSTDRSVSAMRAWKARHGAHWLRILRLERNGGQSAAVLAGARVAVAPIVCTLDGDLQNDPRDLPRMFELMSQGPDVGVVGVRVARQDSFTRRMSSRIGNWFRNRITRDVVTDAACGIKAFRREVFLSVPRFHGMHRFMATLARMQGVEVVELAVHHRPRIAGVAKYGIGNRALRGLWDCMSVRWLAARRIAPVIRDEL